MSTGVNAQANPSVINPAYGRGIQIISSPYIDELSEIVWYVGADYNVASHIGIASLSGSEAPQLRSEPSQIGQARGMVWDIMSIFALYAADWRGLVKNAGA